MALLPPFYLDAVVAIGTDDDIGQRRWIGTGFLYGSLDHRTERYNIWFVTNKHVIEKFRHVYLKFNSAIEQNSSDHKVSLTDNDGTRLWFEHPSGAADIAVSPLNGKKLQDEQRQFSFIQSDKHLMDKSKMRELQTTEGDRVFVLGFPMGLVDSERQYAICRSGILSRIRDYLDNRTNEYLIDASVYPGNSGSPVINCPSAIAIEGTTGSKQADLIGMVKSYLPYKDTAISQQTGRTRIIFEENSGLAAVEGVEVIVETIACAEQRMTDGNPSSSPAE